MLQSRQLTTLDGAHSSRPPTKKITKKSTQRERDEVYYNKTILRREMEYIVIKLNQRGEMEYTHVL